jgi:hypothetical protein
MQAQRYTKYEIAKYEILLIYLHEINYQLQLISDLCGIPKKENGLKDPKIK